jgi:hypothetical protein
VDNPLQEKSDATFVECREVERAIVGMQGTYQLESWRDANGGHREFSCRVLKMSSVFMKITGPVTGSVGEWATVHLERFGQFKGPIVRDGERVLVVRIVATNDERNKIARKIEWAENKKNQDKRQHERLVPRDPHSTLQLPDGRVMPCQIIDYSISGAALSADITPELGTVLIVGKIVGRVERHISEGFAIEFLVIQDRETLAGLFVNPEPLRKERKIQFR